MRVRLVLPALLLAAACGGSDGTTPPGSSRKTADVFMIGDIFSPTFLTIVAGDTVRWNFAGGSDGLGHNVRFTPQTAGAPNDINVLKTGTALRIFNTKDDFHYVCDVHPGMTANVIVQ